MKLARRVNMWLLEESKEGLVMPGASDAKRWVEPDRGDFTVVTRGDYVDFYFGRREIVQVAVSTDTAVAMSRWLLRWYARRLWYGMKLRLWYWSLHLTMQEPADE